MASMKNDISRAAMGSDPIAAQLYDKMVAACDDSKQIIARCEQIRDFLLPLLMNGQVRIGGAA